MTPLEHYQRAEELLRQAAADYEVEPDLADVAVLTAMAQVHATLAAIPQRFR